ncbi:MAG: PhoH family protein, partial [Methylococcales bacterium]|nr:PhoH family protein [Methylococcales bacterium]
MEKTHLSNSFRLEPLDNRRLANLCGEVNRHLRQIEQRLNVEIANHSHAFKITGENHSVTTATAVIKNLFLATNEEQITPEKIHLMMQDSNLTLLNAAPQKISDNEVTIKTKHGLIKGRGKNQQHYLQKIQTHDINFGIGPAGTGKTYLAVACAVEALQTEKVRRIILVRPAVEAGEKLGFLPGDMAQKIDPYLRPLYDALYEMLGFERVDKMIERKIIEVAPLAFMRGRTLNDSFIILDEAQNTTTEQVKMFLTRVGFG